MNETLNDIFDVEPIIPPTSAPVPPPEASVVRVSGSMVAVNGPSHMEKFKANVDEDYDAARENLFFLLEQGKQMLIDAMKVAADTETPRGYEVVGGLIKSLADVNDRLLEIDKQRKALRETEEALPQPGPVVAGNTNIENAIIFNGSTDELGKIVQDQIKGKK